MKPNKMAAIGVGAVGAGIGIRCVHAGFHQKTFDLNESSLAGPSLTTFSFAKGEFEVSPFSCTMLSGCSWVSLLSADVIQGACFQGAFDLGFGAIGPNDPQLTCLGTRPQTEIGVWCVE